MRNETRLASAAVPFVLLLLVAAASAADPGTPPDLSKAQWIWSSTAGHSDGGPESFFRRKFVLAAKPAEATIVVTADNGYELFVNNRRIAGKLGYDGSYWGTVDRFRIEQNLVEGPNVIAIHGENLGGPAGVVAAVYIRTADGRETRFATDKDWLSTAEAKTNWPEPDHDDSAWKPAVAICNMGGQPWGSLSVPAALTDPKRLVVDRSTPGAHRPAKADQFTDPPADFAWPAGVVFVAGRAAGHSTPAQQTKWDIHGSQAFFEYDTPAPSLSGHKLYAMTPAAPGVKPRLLVDAGKGLVASPTCSYDGREIVFAMVPAGEKFFKLFRIGADGTGLERLTTGPWHDYDPAILPDGRIAFASSRTGSRDEYHGNAARSLFCLSADRAKIAPLTYHIVADSKPEVMADGRIAFIRSDNFLERAKVETHIHAIHPDGTSGEVLVGPDRGKVGYDRATGAEIDYHWLRNYGFGCPAPLCDGRIACISQAGPVIASGSAGGSKQQMPCDVSPMDLSPLPDNRLLCSTLGGVLGLLDPESGKVVKLHETDTADLHSVVYLGPKARPPVIAPQVGGENGPANARDAERAGYLFCQRVFDTKQVEGDWQRVKAVRVYMGKPLTLRSARHQYAHIGVEGVELGTAPLAPDGSFYVRVPADRALAIQAVDAEGRPVVNELSWIYVRPGEQRSCTGCHNHRQAAPTYRAALAGFGRPVDLMPAGQPHRFRANNAANGGVLNLQLDRFREPASIDLYRQPAFAAGFDPTTLPSGRKSEVERLARLLADGRTAEKVSAAGRLGILRDRSAVPALLDALRDSNRAVRTAAALAMAACGDRRSVPGLLIALSDEAPEVAQSAHVALENLTGHAEPFNAYGNKAVQAEHAAAWKKWIDANDWTAIEKDLVARVESADSMVAQKAIEALGHVGSEPGKAALRKYVEQSERAPSPSLNARQAALRALGHLGDEAAVPLLARILEENIAEAPLHPQHSHEFGWSAPPDFLAGAAAEALGRIGTPAAEERLLAAYGKLVRFWFYTFRTADHDWLMGCHSSIPHYRIAEALDAIGSRRAADLTGRLLESVPIDTDRALLHENDAYETVTGRVIQRSGTGPRVVETCLAVLGDKDAKSDPQLTASVTASPPAVSVGPLGRESRAAQLLSVVCFRPEDARQVRAAFERYRAREPSRERSWTCFFLARTLGKLGDRESTAVLRAALDADPTEASFGIPDPPNVFLHNAMTPVYRAAAADALGRIGAAEAVPSLLAALGNFENAMEVRQAAADALRRIADPKSLPELERLARDYPEIVTRQSLEEACAAIRQRP